MWKRAIAISPNWLVSCACLAATLLGMQAHAQGQVTTEAKDDAYFAALRKRCENFGFTPATDAFATCVQREASTTPSPEAQEQRRQASRECFLAMLGMPTRSGSFAESMSNAQLCNADPQAHIKLRQAQQQGYVCSLANGGGSLVCTPR
jgi:hypothetical protein